MADAVASDDERKCSTAQSPDTGSSKHVTSKSFKSFFRRKKKPPRMREHCMSIDEPEYQHRHHGAHYHTVTGTSSVGHVIHDQFSRRHYSGVARMRRTHGGQTRSLTDSVSEEDDDDVTHRPDMTSSRRLPDYFRWRYRSANDDVDDDMEQRSTSRSVSGTGGLGGSRVRHWIYSFKQRSRNNSAGASGVHEEPRSRGSKFKVTPTRSLSTNVENHDVISPVQFSEMVRNRTNSDPCFEAWLKAKAAVNSRQVCLLHPHVLTATVLRIRSILINIHRLIKSSCLVLPVNNVHSVFACAWTYAGGLGFKSPFRVKIVCTYMNMNC